MLAGAEGEGIHLGEGRSGGEGAQPPPPQHEKKYADDLRFLPCCVVKSCRFVDQKCNTVKKYAADLLFALSLCR